MPGAATAAAGALGGNQTLPVPFSQLPTTHQGSQECQKHVFEMSGTEKASEMLWETKKQSELEPECAYTVHFRRVEWRGAPVDLTQKRELQQCHDLFCTLLACPSLSGRSLHSFTSKCTLTASLSLFHFMSAVLGLACTVRMHECSQSNQKSIPKNTTTPPKKQLCTRTPQKHHRKNTTTKTPPQKKHHHTTTTKTPPQKHHHKNRTTTPPQKRHHKHTTTKTEPQHHHKNAPANTPPQKHHHNNTTTKHHHTTTKPQKHHPTTTTTKHHHTTTKPQKHHPTTTKTPPHHHKNTTTTPQKHHSSPSPVLSLYYKVLQRVARRHDKFAFYHSFERPTRTKRRKGWGSRMFSSMSCKSPPHTGYSGACRPFGPAGRIARGTNPAPSRGCWKESTT